MPLVSVKFSDHCHFLHFSAELPALGGKKTFAVWYSIVFGFPSVHGYLWQPMCNHISTGSPLIGTYFYLKEKKKKRKRFSRLTEGNGKNMFVFCPGQFIPGSNSSSLAPQEESNSFTDKHGERRFGRKRFRGIHNISVIWTSASLR